MVASLELYVEAFNELELFCWRFFSVGAPCLVLELFSIIDLAEDISGGLFTSEPEDCELPNMFPLAGLLLESVQEITKSVRKRNG